MSNAMISYKHGSDGNTRFYQYKKDPIPSWAIDIQDVDSFLNSRGIPCHPTDTYMHWQDEFPTVKMLEMRAIYDSIVAAGILPSKIEELLSHAYDSGQADEADNNNPDL